MLALVSPAPVPGGGPFANNGGRKNNPKNRITINRKSLGIKREYNISFEGIVNFIENQYKNTESIALRRWANKYMDEIICETCKGSRLKKESLYFKVNNKDINELVNMEITDLISWFKKSNSKLSNTQKYISEDYFNQSMYIIHRFSHYFTGQIGPSRIFSRSSNYTLFCFCPSKSL